jgi:hypothetical protein
MRKLGTALVLSGVLALSAGASAANAGGNTANAKSCQKDGWKSLIRADVAAFANQGDCVSYGAQGGTPVPNNPGGSSF